MSLARMKALAADESGATALVTGVALTAVMGFVALGVDLGVAQAHRRSAQNAADSAAFSGVTALVAGDADTPGQARAVAADYGFAHGSSGVVVAVSRPALTGAYAGQAGSVEVVITRPARRFFGQLLGANASVVSARAVAITASGGDACVLALNPTAPGSVTVNGNANVQLSACSLVANSTSSTALDLNGGSELAAKSAGVGGGYSAGNNSTLIVEGGVQTNRPPVSDPYKDVEPAARGGCTHTNATFGPGAQTIASGAVFCGGVTFNAQADVTLAPGVYYVDGGVFRVNGNATLRGAGVTIVLTGSGSNYATVHINGGSDVTLTAPTSGPTAGVVFYQDRQAPSGEENIFNGGSDLALTGAVYFPKQTVRYNGGSTSTSNTCTQILASEIEFRGNSVLRLNCQGTGVKSIGGSTAKLVE